MANTCVSVCVRACVCGLSSKYLEFFLSTVTFRDRALVDQPHHQSGGKIRPLVIMVVLAGPNWLSSGGGGSPTGEPKRAKGNENEST